MDYLTGIFGSVFKNHIAQAGGVIIGAVTYLVAPTAAFYALWIAVFMDLLSRIFAQSSKNGGFWQATKGKHIQSNLMFRGTAIKIVAYFFMTVLAHQSKHIVEIEAVPIVFSTIVYSILFLVEVHSIIENLIDAGAEDLRPLLLRFQKEKEKAVGATEDIISDVTNRIKEEEKT